jgi:glutaminyl-tRNA synthetase
MENNEKVSRNFIEEIIDNDLSSGKVTKIHTRFPPEPNGYLHIGHAKSLCINFGLAKQYNGTCNLRFDDTNPVKEDNEYVNSIKADIEWLGFKWDNLYYASDYFDVMYNCAVKLIKDGKAYVCDYSAEEISKTRGSLTEPGKESPWRNRSIEENLDLFERMKNGEFADGEKVLRAKIDMASPNINMRDPVIYRIVHATHHNTGDKWCIYPMYDFAHPIEDAHEGITHSICTLEFEDHRPIYNWVTENCGFPQPLPQQIEFARLNVTNTIMSKRFLKRLVDEGKVEGWDDPRMPTLCGLRRRGYPAEALRDFCERIGVSKANSEVESSYLEACVRDNLNINADRAMAVTNPITVKLTGLPDTEPLSIENNPNKEEAETEWSPYPMKF